MYADDQANLKQLPVNMRATQIAAEVGQALQVCVGNCVRLLTVCVFVCVSGGRGKGGPEKCVCVCVWREVGGEQEE